MTEPTPEPRRLGYLAKGGQAILPNAPYPATQTEIPAAPMGDVLPSNDEPTDDPRIAAVAKVFCLDDHGDDPCDWAPYRATAVDVLAAADAVDPVRARLEAVTTELVEAKAQVDAMQREVDAVIAAPHPAEAEVYALLPVKQAWIDAKNQAQKAEEILSRIDRYVDYNISNPVEKAMLKAILGGAKL